MFRNKWSNTQNMFVISLWVCQFVCLNSDRLWPGRACVLYPEESSVQFPEWLWKTPTACVMGNSGCVLGVGSPGHGLHFYPTSSEVRMWRVWSLPTVLRAVMLNCARGQLYFCVLSDTVASTCLNLATYPKGLLGILGKCDCKTDVWLTVHRNSVWIRSTN